MPDEVTICSSKLTSDGRRYSSDLTLDIAYGMDNLTNDDHFNSTAQKAADAIVHGATVAALVEFLPIRTCVISDSCWNWSIELLRTVTYIPAWMPGTIYNQDVVKGRHNVRQLLDVPFSLLVKKIVSTALEHLGISFAEQTQCRYPERTGLPSRQHSLKRSLRMANCHHGRKAILRALQQRCMLVCGHFLRGYVFLLTYTP